MDAGDIARLRRLYEDQPELAVARAEVEPSVVRWAWSKDDHLSPGNLPVADEMSGRGAPALLDEPPDGVRFVEYGFDGDARCVIARRWVRTEHGNDLAEEQLLRYVGAERIAVLYDGFGVSWKVLDVTRRRYDNAGALFSHECFHRTGVYWAMEYTYENGLVMGRTYSESAGIEVDAPPQVDALVRDDAGRLVAVHRGGEQVWSPRPPRRVSVKKVRTLLERDIHAALQEIDDGPWWIVMVRYTADGDWADAAWPTLSVVSTHDRATLTGLAHEDGSWKGAWDWLDWTVSAHEVAVADDTQDALDALDDALDVEEVPKVLRAVASRLSAGLDAIVVACDWELVDLDDALKVLSPGELDELRAAGIAP